jgi:hypothetical protein
MILLNFKINTGAVIVIEYLCTIYADNWYDGADDKVIAIGKTNPIWTTWNGFFKNW